MPRLLLIFVLFVLFMASLMIAQAHVLPRQDASPVTLVPPQVASPPAIPQLSTSSFDWWPYPPGGVITSTVMPMPTSDPVLSMTSSDSSISLDPAMITSDSTTATSDSTTSPMLSPSTTSSASTTSAPSLIQITALTSLPASSQSSSPRTPYRQHHGPINKLWLVPVCVLAGAGLGCALGWVAWRFFGEKKRTGVGGRMDGYAWAYQDQDPDEKENEAENEEADQEDRDMERGHEVRRGHGRAYASLGRRPYSGLGDGRKRILSSASASGARTWIERAQARKRSGTAGKRKASADSTCTSEVAASPLLASFSSADHDTDPKPLPLSPHPSSYPYGDEDEGDDVPYETLRHKSIRRRIWERLGFGDMEVDRSKSRGKEGRNTWSARARGEGGTQVGRSRSLWGRKTLKEGRVERWVNGVTAGDGPYEHAGHEDKDHEPTVYAAGEETPLQHSTPPLDLGWPRSVSPARKYGRVELDVSLTDVLGFEGESPVSYASLRDEELTSSSSPKTVGPGTGRSRATHQGSVRRVGQRARGVSLEDPGPVTESKSASWGTVKKPSTAKKASALHSSPSVKSSRSGTSSRMNAALPTSPSRYSATPPTPTPTILNRTPTRTPTRSAAPKDGRPSPCRATPSARVSRASPAATPPSRGGSTPPRTQPSSGHDGRPARTQQRPPSQLPAGPALVMSPPLQSALSFDSAPPPLRTPPHTTTGPRAPGARLSTSHTRNSSQAAGRSRPPSMRSAAPSSISPNARELATPPRSAYQSGGNTPLPVTISHPHSPKERYLARQSANARVGMILSRSYSSRNFDSGPTSPTMFGAVIDEDVEELRLDDGLTRGQNLYALDGDGRGGGIEQRLDRLKRHEQETRGY